MMATEILVRVYKDGTGDYTNLRAAVIAEAIDLVAADSYIVFELKGDLRNTDAFVDFNPYTTDATRNVIIRPIAADYTDGITGNTGTIYGVNTFAIVSRNEFITIDGLDFDGWTSDFFQPANTSLTNCLMHGASQEILGLASIENTIAYDVGNQSVSGMSGTLTRVTAVNKVSYGNSVTFLIRSITGAITLCAAHNDEASPLNYSIASNIANDFNASNDASAPGTNTQSISTSDFVDYVNDNFNIDPVSPLFALGVGADLVPASGGISIAVAEIGPSFTESINTNLSVNITSAITENGPAFTEAVNVTLTSLTLQASIVESGPSFTESITATLTETLTINADIAEQGPSFTESITASLGVNITSAITELGPSFTESININVIGDRIASIVESGPSFVESIIASIPITITVNPKNIIRVKRKDNTVIIKRKSNIIRVR